jgi:hypothetical protein
LKRGRIAGDFSLPTEDLTLEEYAVGYALQGLVQALQDTSLIDKPYHYVFDNDLYFLKLSLGDRVPADWTFVKEAQRSTLEFSLVVVVLLLWRIIRTYALTKSRETIIGKAFDWVRARLGARLLRFPSRFRHVWLGFQRLGLLTPSRWWVSLLALLISALAVVGRRAAQEAGLRGPHPAG